MDKTFYFSGETENATVPHSTSLAISDIIEKVMQQIGLE